jgi:UDP-glucose 4-epimerase
LVPYITQAAAGLQSRLTIFGNDYPTPDGTCVRDYIHVMDLAEAHVSALRYSVGSNEASLYDTFNLGTGQGQSVLELVHTFEASTGVLLPYQIGPRRAGDVGAVWADVTKARQVLGWSAKRSVGQALEDAWRWQQQLKQMGK